MPTRTVLFDRIGYVTGIGTDGFPEVAIASRGDVVELSDSEAERLDALDAVTDDAAPIDAPPEGMSGSGLADLAGATPNPADETAKVAGIVDQGDAPPPEASSAAPAAEVELSAGFALPVGAGVDLHDNERTATLTGGDERTAGLSAFLGTTAPPPEAASDDDLDGMNATELVAYLNQHNEDVDRVEAVNEARGDKAWVSVTKAVEAIRSSTE